MSKRRNTKHTILIVCEGSNTEPNYFKGIREDVITNEIWTEGISIDIRPTPPLEEDDPSAPPTPKHKTKRKRRQLKREPSTVSAINIEDEYKAVPTRYIREAQKGLEDQTYNEVWAVFDKDYHPRHQEAFVLANEEVNGKKVNIAFSSISFEHWVLLHFEQNNTAFIKSECKGANRKSIKCGSGEHNDDCSGKKCVSGYLKLKNYLPEYSKKSQIDLYNLLKDNTGNAIINARWLRSKMSGTEIYTLNPYCTVDFLVQHLLKIDDQ